MNGRLAGAVAATLVFTVARVAAADDVAVAEQLYELGRQLMAEGRVAEACPRFAESQRLDPATGTLLNLATCHEAEGKLATAWAEFKEGEIASRRDGRVDREEYARQHITAIEPRLSYLTVTVPPANHPPDVEVMMDGKVLGAATWGVAVPVDPGEHEIAARAAGHAPFSAHVTVTYLARRHAVTVALAPAATPPQSSLAAPAAPPPEPAAPPARVAGWVVGGVSLAALGAGAFFAVRASQKWDQRNSGGLCDADDHCSPQGLAFGDQAQTAATLADVSFGVGALGAATATYLLWLRSPATTAARLRLAPSATASAGGLTLTGAW